MANEEHLHLLQQGAQVWNQWRQQHPNVIPDLSDIQLSHSSLKKMDLSSADLSEAILTNVDLFSASLVGANLQRAILTRVSLFSANLVGANLERAILVECDFYMVDASASNFNQVQFRDTSFYGGTLERTSFVAATLHGVKATESNLSRADFSRAILNGVQLDGAILVETCLRQAILINYNFRNLQDVLLWRADVTGMLQCDPFERKIIYDALDLPDLSEPWRFEKLSREVPDRETMAGHLAASDEVVCIADTPAQASFVRMMLYHVWQRHHQAYDQYVPCCHLLDTPFVLLVSGAEGEQDALLRALCEELRAHQYFPLVLNLRYVRVAEHFKEFEEEHVTRLVTLNVLAHFCRFLLADLSSVEGGERTLLEVAAGYQLPTQVVVREGAEGIGDESFVQERPGMLPLHRYQDVNALGMFLHEQGLPLLEQTFRSLQEQRKSLGYYRV